MRRRTQIVLAITFMVAALVMGASYLYISQILRQGINGAHDTASYLSSQLAYLASNAAPDLTSTRVDTTNPESLRRGIAYYLGTDRDLNAALESVVGSWPTIYDAATELVKAKKFAKHPIPVLCHREHLTPVAVCRFCVVDVGGPELARCAEIGAHRPVGVRRDDDQASAGGGAVRRGGCGVFDAGGPDVVPENLAELIVAHAADEPGAPAERRDPDESVGRRAARHLGRGSHRRVDRLGAGGVDEGHRAAGEPVGLDELVALVAEHVDERVADADDVETFGHGLPQVAPVRDGVNVTGTGAMVSRRAADPSPTRG
jgi:hypothetical protein